MILLYKQEIRLVERDRGAKEGVKDVWVSIELLVDHKTGDTHHGSTAIVKFNSLLGTDGGGVPLALLKVNLLDFGLTAGVTHFKDTNEQDDLHKTSNWNGLESSETRLNG